MADNSLLTIVLIVITAGLIFFVPIMSVSARNDRTANQMTQEAVTTFVDTVRETRNNKETRL